MNILAVNNFNFLKPLGIKNNPQQSPVTAPRFGITMSKPLTQDTVSFKARAAIKLLESRKGGVNLKTAIKINEIAEEMQPEIEKLIRGIFADCKFIEHVSGRAKKPGSIVEKSCVLGLSSMEDVFRYMTDLNATKAVMVDGSRKNTHKALDALLNAIKRGFVILEEVEIKRPSAAKALKGKDTAKYDYALPEKLFEFVADAEEAMGKEVSFLDPNYTKANYTAIHFLLRLPGQKRVFEFQLMGHNVAMFKDLDDILYKVLNNKNVDEKYQPIVEILKSISMSKEEKEILKYAKIRDKIEKLQLTTDEQKTMINRVAMSEELIKETDSPEYVTKIKSLIRTKDISEQDLSILMEHAEYQVEYQDKELLKSLRQKAEKYEKFSKYRGQAFLYQREKKASSYGDNAREYFLPLSEDMPSEFDLNNLCKIFLKCNNGQ